MRPKDYCHYLGHLVAACGMMISHLMCSYSDESFGPEAASEAVAVEAETDGTYAMNRKAH